jgi:transforming growth factor-beta-induced protein
LYQRECVRWELGFRCSRIELQTQRNLDCIQPGDGLELLLTTQFIHPQFPEHRMRLPTLATLSLTVFLALPAAAQHTGRSGPTIPQVAKTAGQFTTLLAAVDAAGLSETLLGRGPFTVFAPTDEAFNRLPGGTVQDLLRPENREKLRTILTYHVIAGRVTAAQARMLTSAGTVAGQNVRISTSGDQLKINDAVVRIADVPASNGLIHVIDRVLLPTETQSGSAGSGNSALDIVDLAIERGVPLFNNGQTSATVAIYEVATKSLLAIGDAVPSDARRALRSALDDTRGSESDRAFTLRGGLDAARSSLRSRMSVSRSH